MKLYRNARIAIESVVIACIRKNLLLLDDREP
jgi:hypothetical protein